MAPLLYHLFPFLFKFKKTIINFCLSCALNECPEMYEFQTPNALMKGSLSKCHWSCFTYQWTYYVTNLGLKLMYSQHCCTTYILLFIVFGFVISFNFSRYFHYLILNSINFTFSNCILGAYSGSNSVTLHSER